MTPCGNELDAEREPFRITTHVFIPATVAAICWLLHNIVLFWGAMRSVCRDMSGNSLVTQLSSSLRAISKKTRHKMHDPIYLPPLSKMYRIQMICKPPPPVRRQFYSLQAAKCSVKECPKNIFKKVRLWSGAYENSPRVYWIGSP